MKYSEWTAEHGDPTALSSGTWVVPPPFDYGPAGMDTYIGLIFGDYELFDDDVAVVNAAFNKVVAGVRLGPWREVEAWAALYNGLSQPYKEIVSQSVRVAPNGVGQAMLDAYNNGGAYSERTVNAQDVVDRLRFLGEAKNPMEKVIDAFRPLFVEVVPLCV